MTEQKKPDRLLSLLICWVIHSGILLFIGVSGLAMASLGDPMSYLSFYIPLVGDGILPLVNLIEAMSAGAVWVILLGLAVGAAAIGGFTRSPLGRRLLVVCTWVHIVGLLPALVLLHLRIGFGGILGAFFLILELGTGIASVVVLRGSLKLLAESEWS